MTITKRFWFLNLLTAAKLLTLITVQLERKGHYTPAHVIPLFKLSGFLGNDDQLLKHKVGVSHLKTDSNTVGYTSAYDAKKLNANYQLDVTFDREGTLTQGLSFLTDYQKQISTHLISTMQAIKTCWESLAAEYRLLHDADHSLNISGRYTDSSEYENSWTGRIAGAYRFATITWKRIQASVQRFKTQQSLNITVTTRDIIGNPEFTTRESLGGDVGFLFETHDNRHSLDVTYFARNVKNAISSEVINFTTMQAVR